MGRRRKKQPDIVEAVSGFIILLAIGFMFKVKEWIDNGVILPWLILGAIIIVLILGILIFRRIRSKVALDFSDDKKISYMLRGMSPTEFEEEMSNMFNRYGYKAKPVGKSHDGGIDVIAKRDGKTFLVQCKKFLTSRAGVVDVRSFYGVVSKHNADGGFFITTNEFTQEALNEFRNDKKIKLIDGRELITFYKKSLEKK